MLNESSLLDTVITKVSVLLSTWIFFSDAVSENWTDLPTEEFSRVAVRPRGSRRTWCDCVESGGMEEDADGLSAGGIAGGVRGTYSFFFLFFGGGMHVVFEIPLDAIALCNLPLSLSALSLPPLCSGRFYLHASPTFLPPHSVHASLVFSQ